MVPHSGYSIKRAVLSIVLFILAAPACTAPKSTGDGAPVAFREIWGYLLQGEEQKLSGEEPFTDIAYFAATVGPRGRLRGARELPAVPNAGSPRAHLVTGLLSNPSLTHFCLRKDLPVRDALIGDMISFSGAFHGVQVDFESVMPADAAGFMEFLSELRRRLDPAKTLSVAVPPRTRTVSDAYDYAAIAEAADRVVVMAYDEHWSTSGPGPVASLAWCRSVAEYALRYVPRHKLVMGLPLYGRAWQERNLNRALRYRQVEELLREGKRSSVSRTESGPYFEYEDRVKVIVFYDDEESLLRKMRLYRDFGVRAVSFWRIGQGSRELWRHLAPETDGERSL